MMKQKIVIYESPRNMDRPWIVWDLWRGRKVYVIEPVFAFHYRSRSNFYPQHLPEFVKGLITTGKVQLLTNDQLKSKMIFYEAGDKAVEYVEAVFKALYKKHTSLIQYISDVLRSQKAENAFKINLAGRLGEFFSMNIFLKRITGALGAEVFTFHPRMNICSYQHTQKFAKEAGVAIFNHPKIHFPFQYFWFSAMKNFKAKLMILIKILIQTIGAMFIPSGPVVVQKDKSSYFLGMAIVAPQRQLVGNKRSPDFLVDQKHIKSQDVVYFAQNELTPGQQKHLNQLGKGYIVPRMGRFFSHPKVWARLLRHAFVIKFLSNAEELQTASLILFRYFTWQNILEKVRMKHFVTHCDFGVPHIGRNIALNQAGVQTWYFTDSMNFSGNYREETQKKSYRHPWWTYLTYDHFVTWAQFIVDYFEGHPVGIGQYHIVGCLWNGLDNGKIADVFKEKAHFVIGVFDTGYTLNGIGSYEEGITFIQDILKLADEFPDIQIFFKSKFIRSAIFNADPVFGPQLIDLHDRMEKHPRIEMLSYQKDPSDIISLSDLVISFPFTSTTFEALSMNKLAIWYDPTGIYHETLYGQLPGVVSYGYEELKAKVKELKDDSMKLKDIPIPSGSPLLDPYRDGKALERFRQLLFNPSLSLR